MESSAWGRLIGVLVSPVKTFEAIAQKPTWVVALLVLIVVQLGLGAVAAPRFDMEQEIRQNMERRGQEVSDEQLDEILERADSFRWIGVAFQAVAAPAVYFLLGLVFWLLLRFVGDSDFTYPASMAALTHGYMPWVVATLLSLPLLFARNSLTPTELRSGLLASNLGVLVPEDASPVLKSLLASVDVFSLWTVALLVIGYAAVARTKRSTVAWVVVGLWALYVLGKAGFTALFS